VGIKDEGICKKN